MQEAGEFEPHRAQRSADHRTVNAGALNAAHPALSEEQADRTKHIGLPADAPVEPEIIEVEFGAVERALLSVYTGSGLAEGEDPAVISQVQTNRPGGAAGLSDEGHQRLAPRRTEGAASCTDAGSERVAIVQFARDLGRTRRALQRGQLFLDRCDPYAEGRQFCAELVDEPLDGLDVRPGHLRRWRGCGRRGNLDGLDARQDSGDDHGHLVPGYSPIALEGTIRKALDDALRGELSDRVERPVVGRDVRKRLSKRWGDNHEHEECCN